MNISIRCNSNCTILDLDGKLVFGPATMLLRNTVRDAAQNKPRKIVLNMRKVSYIDSNGIDELISSFTHVRNQDGKLVLLDLPGRIRSLLVMYRLNKVFDIFDDEQSAIADSRENLQEQRMAG